MMANPLGIFTRDARLLVLFDEVYRGLSMTRAAEKLGLSQPTVSIWIGKMRRHLKDPLFVRMTNGLKPTPRADALIGPVRQTLESLRRLSGEALVFDPAKESRVFRIAMTDASHVTLLPAILSRIRTLGPNLGLEVLPISAGTGHDLQEGRADLAIGSVAGLESGFHEQKLYDQNFVCLVSAKHPRIGPDGMSARTYLHEAHIGILSGASYSSLRVSLASQHLRRRIMLELPGFMGVAVIVATTDLVATVPRHIGETLAQGDAIRVVPCPIRVAGFAVKQYWHERYHRDPGHRWLRSLSFDLFNRGNPQRPPRISRGKSGTLSGM
jgi:DNA-binding transcriptional LysR family regulator